MEYVPIDEQNRQSVNAFISEHWYTTDMIIRGERIDMTKVDGILALETNRIFGLLTYIISDDGIFEITSLDSLAEGNGIGTALIDRAVLLAKENKRRKVIVITTNDNINAIRFYQKRGFDLAKLYHNALDLSRAMKPEIPLVGENGILLKHELEFVLEL